MSFQTIESREGNDDIMTEEIEQIPIEYIKKYRDENIPIRPTNSEGKPDVSNIFTEGESDKILRGLPNNLKELVCEDGKIHLLKLLAAQPLSPKEFWTDERIARQKWFGIECQTGFIASLSAGHQCAGTDLSPDCDPPMPSPANCAATAIKLDELPERVIR